MKKMFVLAALALACVGARAAYVDWQVKGVADNVGSQIYIVGALSEDWTSVADIAAAASAFGTGTSDTLVKAGRNYSASGTIVSDNVTKTAGDVYFIIVSGSDATSYKYVKYDLKGLTYEGIETPPGSHDISAASLLAGSTGTFAGGGGDVPEPTSGLLALVGLAGLALRRRRA